MKNVKRKTIAIWEIALMISFSFAFSFILGESFGFGVGVVSGQGDGTIFAVTGGADGPGLITNPVPATLAGPATVPGAVESASEGTFIFDSATGSNPIGAIGANGEVFLPEGYSGPAFLGDTEIIGMGDGGTILSQVSGGSSAIAETTQPVFYGGKLYNGVNLMKSADGVWVGNIKGVGPVSWAEKTKAWVPTPEGQVPAGLTESGTLAQGTAGQLTTGGTYAGGQGTLTSLFTGNAFGGAGSLGGAVFSSLLSGAIWGAMVGGIAYGLALMFGQNKDQAASIGLGAGAGTFVGTTAYFLAQNGVLGPALQASGGALLGLGLGLGVGAAIIILTYKKQKKELVRFECLPWEPPRGGANCDVCNEDETKPCSEYRCKSLGAGCELINQGSKEEKCVWITKGDTAAPHMEPSQEALTNGLSYIPDSAISPPNRGFKIIDHTGDECLQPFTNLEFGITTDEPAQCKLDLTPKATFDEMQFLFGDSNLFLEEHKQKIKVPSPFTETGENVPEIGIDGTFTLWARCIDANGNGKDSAMVAFRYCVDPAPDTTQPVVTSTSVTSSSYVGFNADKVPVEVYVNEPAECRWSRQDKDFDSMENTMTCATESYQINADLNYACSGDLTGIENKADNWFYFRCRDYSTAPGGRNTMTSSYPLLLRGTEELTVTKVGPTGEFKGSASVVTVDLTAETAHGAEEGKAICYFDTEENGNFEIAMDNTNSYQHNQSLDLGAGNYIYYFRCIDAGGNSASASTNFTVTVDTTLPSVTRVLKDGNLLKVITSEEAKCAYSETSCNFNLEEGIALTYENPTVRIVHTAEWKDAITYYIKCEDLMGNQPRPDYCHMIVKASEL